MNFDSNEYAPLIHSQRLHEASSNSKLIVMDDENHDSIMRDRTGIIQRETLAWLAEHLNK